MTSGIKYEREFKDRAVRLYAERRAEHQEESKAAALRHVAKIVGMPEDTLRTWTRRAEVDAGERPGVTSDMAADLRRANEILRTASAFFAASESHRCS
ncbi:transposase [Arthrobacter halodurans]|uniref:Transposase n=1 Tax=Arthrobacter halodurans TaxID=516699 RepID=A0ABV4UPQ7_9MICC